MNAKSPVIRSLHLRNYRSIRDETIHFDNPLFLVGRNGSGKSNVVDALAFLSDCMHLSFAAALSQRHGIIHVRASEEDPSVILELTLEKGHYILQFRYHQDKGIFIEKELGKWEDDFFERVGDKVQTSIVGINPHLTDQGLALPLLGGTDNFSNLFDVIRGMSVHHVNYQSIRLSEATGGSHTNRLSKDTANTGNVLARLSQPTQQVVNRWVRQFVDMFAVFPYPSAKEGFLLGFAQQGTGQRDVWKSSSVSDGTLNAVGMIVALLQEPTPSLIVLEEPETNLHPGVLNAVADLILDASERTQVVVTTHSPDLLDAKWICPENLRIVSWEQGATQVRPLGEVPQSALREHLMYAGQLLRANALDAAP